MYAYSLTGDIVEPAVLTIICLIFILLIQFNYKALALTVIITQSLHDTPSSEISFVIIMASRFLALSIKNELDLAKN